MSVSAAVASSSLVLGVCHFSLALADRVYILGKGSIRHTGPTAELRDDTALRDRLLAL